VAKVPRTFHRRFGRLGQEQGAGVIYQDVDAAEGIRRLCNGSLDLFLPAHVHGNRQRSATRRDDLVRHCVDRAGELGVGFICLRGDGDVGAVRRGAKRDGPADATARAGDEQGFVFE